MFRCLVWAIAAAVRPKRLLIADNLCLRQQLLVLQRRKPRPRLKDADRRFWVLACRWFVGWRTSVLIVKPETVLRWHRHGWRTYWRWRSSGKGKAGRRQIAPELRALIRRMAIENRLWGQRRIQAELTRLGFKVSARTVAKYMHREHYRGPSSRWRSFLRQHASTVWACDFFCVHTITFRTLYVFFVIHHASRQVLHVGVIQHPTAEWTA
jgi:HTH-like domain